MTGVNRVFLLGNLGADPEVRFTPEGTPVVTFRIATNELRTNPRTGQREQVTEWHRIVAFGRLGEICGEYLKKGRQVYIEGRLRTRSWEDARGQRHSVTEVVAQQVVLLGGPSADSEETRFEEVDLDRPSGAAQRAEEPIPEPFEDPLEGAEQEPEEKPRWRLSPPAAQPASRFQRRRER